MVQLNVFELDKIKQICESAGTEYFTLEQSTGSGIGSILTLIYDTEIADFPATVRVEVTGVKNW
jgi:hypothetical protein